MSGVGDGGPAYPNAWIETNQHGVQYPMVHDGMRLRDALAIGALPGIITSVSAGQHMLDLRAGETMNHAIARGAYALADAMLVVRKEPQP